MKILSGDIQLYSFVDKVAQHITFSRIYKSQAKELKIKSSDKRLIKRASCSTNNYFNASVQVWICSVLDSSIETSLDDSVTTSQRDLCKVSFVINKTRFSHSFNSTKTDSTKIET